MKESTIAQAIQLTRRGKYIQRKRSKVKPELLILFRGEQISQNSFTMETRKKYLIGQLELLMHKSQKMKITPHLSSLISPKTGRISLENS